MVKFILVNIFCYPKVMYKTISIKQIAPNGRNCVQLLPVHFRITLKLSILTHKAVLKLKFSIYNIGQ